jgi:hypothetical protein
LIGVDIRLLLMQTAPQRRERENRQINERPRTLIAAYKTLRVSFTGNLAVDPAHLRDLKHASMAVSAVAPVALIADSGDITLHYSTAVSFYREAINLCACWYLRYKLNIPLD